MIPVSSWFSLTEVKMIFENNILDDCHCFIFLKRFDCIVILQFIHYRRQEFTTSKNHASRRVFIEDMKLKELRVGYASKP